MGKSLGSSVYLKRIASEDIVTMLFLIQRFSLTLTSLFFPNIYYVLSSHLTANIAGSPAEWTALLTIVPLNHSAP